MGIIKYFKDMHNDRINIEKNTDEFVEKIKKNGLRLTDISDYVAKCGGYHKLKKKYIDKIIAVMPLNAIERDIIFDIYDSASDNESNKTIIIWTWIVGIATVINLVISIIGFNR